MRLLASTILALGISGSSLLAQDIPESQVPEAVRNAFVREYANPIDVDWEKERGNFEVDFELGGLDHVALFNPDGQLLKAKKDIREADLPSAVRQRIADDHAKFTIDDVDELTVEGRVYYQVELDGRFRDRKVVYAGDGQEAKDVKYWD